MLRFIKIVFLRFFRIAGFCFKLIRWEKHRDDITDEELYTEVRKMVEMVNKAGKISVKAEGIENFPADNGFMIYPNHQGMYDVLAMLEVFPVKFSFVYKQELDKISCLRRLFSLLNAYAIDRDDVRQSLKVINNVCDRVREGRNYLIFAEGTRNRDENNVHDFKAGSFKIATKTRCPIVPVAHADSYKVLDSKGTEPVTVKIRVLKPICYDEYKDMNTAEIAAYVQKLVSDAVTELASE